MSATKRPRSPGGEAKAPAKKKAKPSYGKEFSKEDWKKLEEVVRKYLGRCSTRASLSFFYIFFIFFCGGGCCCFDV